MSDSKGHLKDTSTESVGSRMELACDQFEAAWKSGQPPEIDDFLVNWTAPHRSILLRELLLLDIHYRDQSGDPPSQSVYSAKFPDAAGIIKEIFSTTETIFRDPNAPATPDHAVEQLGDYELLEELGRGGMGIVYRARQSSADRIVALKVIRHDHLDGMSGTRRDEMIGRFRTEARAAARLEHDHLVTIYDVGEIDGRHYYSMRFVKGTDLAELVRDEPLDERRAARYIESAARGVHEAHRQGILHRDLKPANILIDERTDRALVTDFGLARFHTGDSTATRAEDLLGSPSYMSPEQAECPLNVTATADTYSLGATLYHLIIGRPPFHAATIAHTLDQVRHNEPVAPRELNPAIDRDLETICLKCLAKDPSRRYESAKDLGDDLRRFLNNEPIVAKPPTPLDRFLRWYPKHASMILGAYYIVSPLTWFFFILGGLLQPHDQDGLRLASPIFLPWAFGWMWVGYNIVKRGFRFEVANIALIVAFALLPLVLQDYAQSIVLIGMITLIGCVLQVGAMIARSRKYRPPTADSSSLSTELEPFDVTTLV